MSNHVVFYKHMARYYREARNRAERDGEIVWGVALDAIAAIAESPHDGSGMNDLKKRGDELTSRLRNLIDPPNLRDHLMGLNDEPSKD
jgi:hypothetical protein